jgi:colicin import membrane protein
VKKKEDAPALEKRPQPGRIRAILLAVVVHAVFFGLIVFGVTWQNKPAPPLEAELWDKLPKGPVSKPPDTKPPEPEPEPPKPEPPKPEPPKPEPPPPKPPEQKPEPPKPDPAIAQKAEREKKEREKKEKAEREKREKEKQDEAKKKREKEEAAKKKKEDEKRRQEEEKVRVEAERARQAAEAAQAAEIDKYINQIKSKIRGKANIPDTVTGNPEVTVNIKVLPGGEVLDVRIIKRSGNPTYDSAIERAIRSAQPLPVPAANSELFPRFRDLNLNIRHER